MKGNLKLQMKTCTEVLIWDFYQWVHPQSANQSSISGWSLLQQRLHIKTSASQFPSVQRTKVKMPTQLSKSPPRKKQHLSNIVTPLGRDTSTWRWHKLAFGTESFPGENKSHRKWCLQSSGEWRAHRPWNETALPLTRGNRASTANADPNL